MLRNLFLVITAISLSACAFGDATLTVNLDEEGTREGVLSQAPATIFAVEEFVDKRPDRELVGRDEKTEPKKPFFIGYKRNSYNQKTANILMDTTVTETVRTALADMLETNGHSVGSGGPVTLDATVKDFWFDLKAGLVTVEFFGTVDTDITLTDTATGQQLFSENFVGYHSRKTAGGLAGTWTEVMKDALADLVRQVSLSTDFKDAVEAASGEDAAGDVTSSGESDGEPTS